MAKKKKRWLKIGLPVIAAVIIVLLIAANLLRKKDKGVEVMAEKVRVGKLVETVPGTGRVQPEVQVKISANVSGRIAEIRIKEGDRVQKGDLLVRLDRERYEAAVGQARSALKSAEAALEKSRSELRRVKELNQRGMASESDLESAQADFQLRSAEVERSQAALAQTEDDLAKTSIYAPMDGIVSLLNKEAGEMALGAQFQEDVILIVADLSKMEVEVEIDESDVVNVSLKDSARVKIDAYPDTVFRGQVREIAHTATTRGLGTPEELTNFRVDIALLEVPKGLRPGMSATADVVTAVRENALQIPIQCVVLREPLKETKEESDKEGKDNQGVARADTLESPKTGEEVASVKQKPIEVVFKIEDGVVHQIPVVTGISSDTNIEILSGLSENDKVVSGPFRTLTQKLKDGDAVKEKSKPGQKGEGASDRQPDEGMMDEM